MYWQEVPYRVASLLRGFAQSQGMFSAIRVPAMAADCRWGNPWSRVPTSVEDAPLLYETAGRLLDGDLKVFDQRVPMRDGIPDWNVDPVTGTRIGLIFGLYIDFRHLGADVDIKHLWEINRLLWWIPLAQCFAVTGDRKYLDRIGRLLSSWLDACPYPLGANWSSPVEQGIRLINWSVVWHLIGGAGSPLFEGSEGADLRQRWLVSIYQHMRFASDNYSLHSSANNHLVGEAAGVFVAAHVWDCWDDARRLRREAKAILEREALRQFSSDGVNLEQAIGYHKFCLQFLLACGLCGRMNDDDFAASFWSRIDAAMTFLASMMDCAGHVPSIGDSDDGEVWRFGYGAEFNSYLSLLAVGATLFARGDLQAKVASVSKGPDTQVPWLLGDVVPDTNLAEPQKFPTRFEIGGYVLLGEHLHSPQEFRVTFDCGPLGLNGIAGHGHADALSVLISWGGEPLLVDSGTYCYNAAPTYRHFFRGTRAHNTLLVDGLDQSEYASSFLWLRDVNSTLVAEAGATGQSVHACHDGYKRLPDPVVHHRRVSLASDSGCLLIEDWLECAQPHGVELLWHAAPGVRLSPDGSGNAWLLEGRDHTLCLELDGANIDAVVVQGCESPVQGWVSSRFYERTSAQVLAVQAQLSPRQVLRTFIHRGRTPSMFSALVERDRPLVTPNQHRRTSFQDGDDLQAVDATTMRFA
jgi:Heparinase II/III-like protein/Heparinase II/III N-terminus